MGSELNNIVKGLGHSSMEKLNIRSQEWKNPAFWGSFDGSLWPLPGFQE
jgi:hypothetical protein